MLDKWFAKGSMPIGLDLGGSCIRMLQFDRKGGRWSVAAAASGDAAIDLRAIHPRREQELVAHIAKLVDRAQPHGRRVVLALPESVVRYQVLRLPRMSEEELARSMASQTHQRIGETGRSFHMQHLVAGEVQQAGDVVQEVIAIAVDDVVLDMCVRVMQACDLEPVAIDIAPTALVRSFTRAMPHDTTDESTQMFVDVGFNTSKVLITQGRRICFYRNIDIAGRHINAAVAEYLKISAVDAADLRRRKLAGRIDPRAADHQLFGSQRREDVEHALNDAVRGVFEELAKEINLCRRYHSVTFCGSRPDRIMLSGGEAQDPQLAAAIARWLGVGVYQFDPFDGIDDTQRLTPEQPGARTGWTTVAGLATRRIDADRGGSRRSAA